MSTKSHTHKTKLMQSMTQSNRGWTMEPAIWTKAMPNKPHESVFSHFWHFCPTGNAEPREG